MDETALLSPTPAKLAIWTDRLGYLRGRDLIRVYLEIDPRGERRRFSEFIYLENIETGQRRYLARKAAAHWRLRDEVADSDGRGPRYFGNGHVQELTPTKIWTGRALDPGLFQFVVELRSPDTTEIAKRACAKFVVSEWIPRLLGTGGAGTEIAADTIWTNDRIYALRHRVSVKAGATLTIEPGTLILARGPDAAIVVERGGRIMAEGSVAAPIVMTCDEPVGQRFEGCWKGLVVAGGAPSPRGPALMDDSVAGSWPAFGGDDAMDSSGALRYVRVEFAGASPAPAPTAAGFGFYGVGSGTRIDHIQSHASGGDGIKFVGGTANCTHCVSSAALDDGLDLALGWRGTAQFTFVRQGPAGGASAIKVSNVEQLSESGQPSAARIYNATIVGDSARDMPAGKSVGMLLQEDSAVFVRNALITGFGGPAIEMRGSASSMLESGSSSIRNTIIFANGTQLGKSQIRGDAAESVEWRGLDPMVSNPHYEANLDPRPTLDSPARKMGRAAVPPSDGILDTSAQYIGAFGDWNWLEEWTFFGDERDYASTQ